MSDQASFGELMDAAAARNDAAQWRIITCRFVDEDAARATIAARASMLSALREQVVAMREFATLEDLRAVDYVDGHEYSRAYTPPVGTPRTRFYGASSIARGKTFVPDRTAAAERFSDSVQAILAVAPVDDGSPSPAADRYREATQLIRAATDLVDTHRTIQFLPARAPDFGASRPALELAIAASDGNHFLMTRAHQVGVRAKEIRTWLAVGHDVGLHDASAALLTFTPATPDQLPDTRLAGTVRSDTLAHEWADRVDRVDARLSRLATSTEVNVRTMGYVAFVGLVNDRLTGADNAEQWHAVVDQLRAWKGVSPADPRIVEDQRRLRSIALQVSSDPRSPQTRDVLAAALSSRQAVDSMAATANTIMHSVRRWTPVDHKPTPAYLQEVKVGAHLARFAPTEAAQLWPASTDSMVL